MFGMRISSLARGLCDLVELRKNANMTYDKDYRGCAVNAIHFTLDCKVNSYTDEADFIHNETVHVLICGNHAVFVATEKRGENGYGFKPVQASDYEMLTHHDTWPESLESHISNIYFKLSKMVNEDRVAAGLPELPPARMSTFFWFGLSGRPTKARVDMVPINPADTYQKKVTLVTTGPNEWEIKKVAA